MAGLSNIFSNETLVEGMGLVAGLSGAALEDPDLASTQAELKALKAEVDVATSSLTDAMWDDVDDSDLQFILKVQAGLRGMCRLTVLSNMFGFPQPPAQMLRLPSACKPAKQVKSRRARKHLSIPKTRSRLMTRVMMPMPRCSNHRLPRPRKPSPRG